MYCGPSPVVFKVNNYCIFEIKLIAYGANAICIYVIAKLGIFGINKTALAVLTLQAGCRLCVFTYVRNRNCNVNSRTIECDNNDATVFSYGVSLVFTGISNSPVDIVIANNLKLVRTFFNVLIYLGPYTVSVCHIVSGVSNVPLGAEMSACTCYYEGSRLSAYCAHMLSIKAGMSESRNYDLFAIETHLRLGTCCCRTAVLVRTFGNGSFNCNCNCSALKSDSDSATSCSYGKTLVRTGISSAPAVVASNLKLVCTCCNVLIYLSIYAVSEGHIVCCITCIPFSAKVSACTCYCEGSLSVTSCAKVSCVIIMSKSGNYGIATVITYLIGSTCSCRAEICVRTSGIKGAPCSAATIPSTFLNGIMVSTVSRDGKVCCLIPFVIPVVS